MADVNAGQNLADPLRFLREEELRAGAEQLLFAARDIGADGEVELTSLGLGHAHGRLLALIARRGPLTVYEALRLLRITKQSLNRVTQDLATRGLIAIEPDRSDRRRRQIRLTDEGRALEQRLWRERAVRIAAAFREAGPEAVAGFRRVLAALAAVRRPR